MTTGTKVYAVSTRNNSWTNKAVAIQAYIDKGASIKQARLNGDYTLFINGYNMAILFKNQKDQISYLKDNGMI